MTKIEECHIERSRNAIKNDISNVFDSYAGYLRHKAMLYVSPILRLTSQCILTFVMY
jgi:hypothetical protein